MKKTILLSLAGCALVGAAVYFTQSENKLDFSSQADRNIAGPQKNICSITINSDDEIRMFKQKLASDGRFKFTELTSTNENWFNQSCASNVQCDVLVISGHFGGTFFGKTGNHLSLSELETQSCSKKCTGILEQPKEVYLFGCNTLASKGPATRTPEQYLQVLLEDGLERSFAERVVEARYGPSGEQNVNRMKRAFPSVPVIYGFCDKAPLGEEAGPIMKAYLSGKSKDDYYDRLNRLENIKNTLQPYSAATIQQLIDVPLATAFKNVHRCFGQITGVDTKDETAGRICAVRDVKNSIEARARELNILMHTPESLSYIELCNDFFVEIGKKALTPSELAAVAQVKNNQKLREDLMFLLDKMSFFLGYDYGVLAVQLGMDKSKITPILSRGFINMISKGLTREELNLMMNVDFKFPYEGYIKYSYSDIDTPATWASSHSIQAIGLTKTKDAKIIARLQGMISTAAPEMRSQLLEALISLDAVDIQARETLISMLYDKNPDVRANSIRALGTIKTYDEKIITEVVALMNRETDAWTLKKSALYFVDVKFDSPSVQAHLARFLTHANYEVRLYSALALVNRSLKDRSIFESLVSCLKDPNGEVKANCQLALRKNRQSIPADVANRIHSESPIEYQDIYK